LVNVLIRPDLIASSQGTIECCSSAYSPMGLHLQKTLPHSSQ